MKGTESVRFSDLFADTLNTHGVKFAHRHYVTKGGMPQWEFRHWMKVSRA